MPTQRTQTGHAINEKPKSFNFDSMKSIFRMWRFFRERFKERERECMCEKQMKDGSLTSFVHSYIMH